MDPEQNYKAARKRAAAALERLDSAWRRGEQGTAEGRDALTELNSAVKEVAAEYGRYVATFTKPS